MNNPELTNLKKKCPKCHRILDCSLFHGPYPSRKIASWCKECIKIRSNDKWPKRTPEEKILRKKKFREWYGHLREEVLNAYGRKCQCCGEVRLEFLTIDHIHGGGNKHRKQLGNGTAFFVWLKENGFPKEDYRTLCMNCNWARGRYGYCPHEGESH